MGGSRLAPSRSGRRRSERALQGGVAAPPGIQGSLRVVLLLWVAPDGRLRSAEVLRSSGDATLDALTLRGVRRMGRLPRAPAGLSGDAYDFTAPVDLRAP